MYLRTYIKISTEQGEFERLGGIYFLPGSTVSVDKNYLSYPDARVSIFRIYATDSSAPYSSGTVWKYLEYKAQHSKRGNISYAASPAILYSAMPAGQTITTAGFASIVERDDQDRNRVLVSTANKPRNILGRNAHYIGNSADDGVMTFATNAVAISAGQFGQYPLYAMCNRSIWIMEVGEGDIAFRSVKPVTERHGLLSKNGVLNIDNTIFYLATDGLRTLPANELPISFAVQGSQDEEEENDFLANVNSESALGYFYDSSTGRKELWITAGNGIYCYSISMNRWFMVEGERSRFLSVKEKLIGLKDGYFVDERSDVLRAGYFSTAPIHFGEPEISKRFRNVILRTTSGDTVLYHNGTIYQLAISRTMNAGEGIYGIDFEFELRYGHRARVQQTEVTRII